MRMILSERGQNVSIKQLSFVHMSFTIDFSQSESVKFTANSMEAAPPGCTLTHYRLLT